MYDGESGGVESARVSDVSGMNDRDAECRWGRQVAHIVDVHAVAAGSLRDRDLSGGARRGSRIRAGQGAARRAVRRSETESHDDGRWAEAGERDADGAGLRDREGVEV